MMKDVAEFIERTLWFIYRVFFTLIPGTLLLLLALFFAGAYFPNYFDKLSPVIEKLGIGTWVMVFASIFCTSVVLESLANVIVYQILNLKKISIQVYKTNLAFHRLLEEYSPTLLRIMEINKETMYLDPGLFEFGQLVGNQRSGWFNNHIWFLISREFIFSNLSLAILVSVVFLLPYSIFHVFHLTFFLFLSLQAFEIVFIIVVLLYSRVLLEHNYLNDKVNLESSRFELKNGLLIGLPILLSLLSGILVEWEVLKPLGCFLVANFLMCFLCPILFLRTLHEYLHVEYLIIGAFAERKYNDERAAIQKGAS